MVARVKLNHKGNGHSKNGGISNYARRGSPDIYRTAFAEQATRACQAGFTDIELAELFGVSHVTINNWKLKHSEFALALKKGKEPADDRVERSLYQRAVGYYLDVEKLFCHNGEVIRATVHEYFQPDVAAAFIWLKNRRKDTWRDKHEVDVSGQVHNVFTLNIFEHDLSGGMKVIEGKKSVPRLRSES
jgi:hypothetical protein